ncbi:RNA polymerase subunit sigma-70 [Crossiella sp. CA198]|uniref:RNA polymerase subunit sigma-70 n=1 Tax=Crossiella sp. CA198 TaxID=3455607 RepID=UPI003F8D2591
MDVAVTMNEQDFGQLVERHRHELRVHCYRMVGSFEESEDLVQETFLRAWHRRETYQGRATLRAWLYRIATNASLDAIAKRPAPQQTAVADPELATTSEVSWLQPYPDQLLELAAPAADEPDAVVVARETIELAYLTALQHLPPRQRAVLILRDVLGWAAAETAKALDTTVASANSALQRARATLKDHLPRRRADWTVPAEPSAEERDILARFIAATESADMTAMAQLLHADALHTMPPHPFSMRGRDELIAQWSLVMPGGSDSWGQWAALPTWVNRQPAVANYVLKPGATEYTVAALDVLRVEDGLVAEVVTFEGKLITAFGLPATLPITR